MEQMLDLGEIARRMIKYLIEGIFVALAAWTIPKKSLNMEECLILAVVASCTFAILDTWLPAIGASARSGAGFGIGANMVGFPSGTPMALS